MSTGPAKTHGVAALAFVTLAAWAALASARAPVVEPDCTIRASSSTGGSSWWTPSRT